VYDKASIDQGIHNWTVRHFDGYGDGVCRACHREKPVTQLCQTSTAMQECSLADDRAVTVENADLMLL